MSGFVRPETIYIVVGMAVCNVVGYGLGYLIARAIAACRP